MLKEKIRSVFTKKVLIQRGKRKKIERIEIPPSERLVYGICFAIAALVSLTVLEVAHMAFLESWNSEIFAAITSIIGAILGVFISQRV
jgi:uncharacterized protein YqgC (DUF456 family)